METQRDGRGRHVITTRHNPGSAAPGPGINCSRCVALATGSVLGPAEFELIKNPAADVGSTSSPPPAVDGPSFREQMEAFERNLLVNALAATQNNQSEAARRLGLTRATLYDRLKKFGLLPDSARSGA